MENTNGVSTTPNNVVAEKTENQSTTDTNNQEQLNKINWESDDNPYKKDALTYKGKFEHAKKKLKEITSESDEDPKPQSIPQTNNGNDNKVDIIYQKVNHPELSLDMINEIDSIARSKGISFDEALAHPLIKNALEFESQKTKDNNASISSTRAPMHNGADISKLTEQERKDIFLQAIQGRR